MSIGAISSSPGVPEYAFSIHALESYRRLRLRHPRLSIQAFVKALCDTQIQIFRSSLARHFSSAFDVYLRILRIVDQRITTALSRDSPQWRIQNSCPCCQYVLDGEEPLKYDLLCSMDGGSSLKRFAKAGSASTAQFNSSYILPRSAIDQHAKKGPSSGDDATAEVDVTGLPDDAPAAKKGVTKGGKKGKVKKGKAKKGKGAAVDAEESTSVMTDVSSTTQATTSATSNKDPDLDEDGEIELQAPEEMENVDMVWVDKGPAVGSPVHDENGVISACVERWKANASDAKKGMFECFFEAGIFIILCRHGVVLITADMVQSGEL